MIEKCDELIESIRARRQYLLDTLNNEKEMKILTLKEQVSHCTSLLQRTTGLLQFGIEVLKESDAFSFLQVILYFDENSLKYFFGYNSGF